MKLKKWIFGALMMIGGMTAAQAALVEFTHSGYLRSSRIPGTADEFTLTIRADNGGVGVASQRWSVTDLISATFTSGSYNQSALGNFYDQTRSPMFYTNSDGVVVFPDFYGTNPGAHQDSFGTGEKVYLAANLVSDFYGRTAYFECCFSNRDAWSLALVDAEPSEVAEPESLALVGLALAGVAAVRRRKMA